MSKLSPARSVALEVCRSVRERSAFTSHVLDAVLPKAKLSSEDAAFVRVLALGVTSTWGTLDDVINQGLSSPADVNENVRDALRISTYEMLFLDKEPYVAVSQGVELVRSVEPRAAKLANFALHRVAEYVQNMNALYNKVAQEERETLAQQFGFPRWLEQKLVSVLGFDRAKQFMKESNNPAPLFLALNACCASDADTLGELEAACVGMRPVRFGVDGQPIPGALRIAQAKSVGEWPISDMLKHGACIVADASAQVIAYLSIPDPDDSINSSRPVRFLEIGSGRGTKTVLIQSQAQRRYGLPFSLTCVDKHGFKAEVLRDRANKLNVPIQDIVHADATDLSQVLSGRLFDACLIDAPCSGLGTLRRHPEIRWNLQPEEIESLAHTGLQLLTEASRYIVPGGRITYSTCTILPEENEAVIKAFLESEAGKDFDIVPLELAGTKRLTFQTDLASGGPDAHFACVLRRRK